MEKSLRFIENGGAKRAEPRVTGAQQSIFDVNASAVSERSGRIIESVAMPERAEPRATGARQTIFIGMLQRFGAKRQEKKNLIG